MTEKAPRRTEVMDQVRKHCEDRARELLGTTGSVLSLGCSSVEAHGTGRPAGGGEH